MLMLCRGAHRSRTLAAHCHRGGRCAVPPRLVTPRGESGRLPPRRPGTEPRSCRRWLPWSAGLSNDAAAPSGLVWPAPAASAAATGAAAASSAAAAASVGRQPLPLCPATLQTLQAAVSGGRRRQQRRKRARRSATPLLLAPPVGPACLDYAAGPGVVAAAACGGCAPPTWPARAAGNCNKRSARGDKRPGRPRGPHFPGPGRLGGYVPSTDAERGWMGAVPTAEWPSGGPAPRL